MTRLLTGLAAAAAVAVVLAGDAAAQKKDAAPLPPEVTEVVDPDKDGKITDAEAAQAVEELQRRANAKEDSPKKEAILKALDANGDKKVDADEAQSAVAQARAGTDQGKRLAELFDSLDANKDGALSKREFENLSDKLGLGRGFVKGREQELFRELDANRDGKITKVEAQLGASRLGPRFGAKGQGAAAPPAVDPLRDQVQRQLALLDKDKVGKLSEKEARAHRDLRPRFKQIDTDLDEYLTLDELVEFARSAQAEKSK